MTSRPTSEHRKSRSASVVTSAHHSIKQPRSGGRFVKQRTNGKHKIEGATVSTPLGSMARIVRPQARYNWLMPNIGSITPQFIEMTLNGALAGNHVQQWSLFDLMLRTWPELRSCYTELVTSVLRKTIIFEPYCEEDEQPTPNAIEKSKLVSTALRKMEPDSQNDGNDFEGTIKDILDAWFRGYAVSEVVWNMIDDRQVGMIQAPRTTFWVDPCNYAFDTYNSIGLLPQRQSQGGSFPPFANTALQLTQREKLIPFPENKFLVGICKSKSGSPLAGAMLVPLAWWWCAANFSSDWLLNLAQVFGLPFRWANYDANAPQATIDAICNMLQNMGSAGWAAFPVGTTLELHQPSQTGSDHSPQGELLDRADRYCRTLILGQTMTGTHGTTGKGGGQAFGKVEEDVKADRIDAAGKFAMSVINRQLIPSILALNYGDTDEAPSAKFLEDEVADLTEAQRDKTLVDAGLPIGVDYARKKYDIPAPAEGEETLSKPEPATPFGGQGFGGDQSRGNQDGNSNQDSQSTGEARAKAISASGDLPGHPFHGNQWTHEQIDSARIQFSTIKGRWGARKIFINGNHRGEIATDFHNKTASMTVDGHRVELPSTDMSDTHGHQEQVRRILRTHASVKSSDQTGHPFRGNQYVTLGAHVNTPHGQGVVVATDDLHAWVSVNGTIRKVKRGELSKIPTKPPFPSLLPSEEEKRRLMRNAGLQTKLEQLNEIEDDAVFARELKELASEVKAAGDLPGHPFRGNQYKHGGPVTNENSPAAKVHMIKLFESGKHDEAWQLFQKLPGAKKIPREQFMETMTRLNKEKQEAADFDRRMSS